MPDPRGRDAFGSEFDDESAARSEFNLSAPWGYANIASNIGLTSNERSTERFLVERTRLHELYIRKQALIRLVSIILAFLLIVLAVVAILFAPAGREKLSYWIGGALIIFAAGAIGFQRVWGKASALSFGADQDKRNL